MVSGVVRWAALSLDRTVDKSRIGVKEAEVSNRLSRAFGLGVQGLADVFALLEIPFDSVEAAAVNRLLFEFIYYTGWNCSLLFNVSELFSTQNVKVCVFFLSRSS